MKTTLILLGAWIIPIIIFSIRWFSGSRTDHFQLIDMGYFVIIILWSILILSIAIGVIVGSLI